jgi:hypothetical protein
MGAGASQHGVSQQQEMVKTITIQWLEGKGSSKGKQMSETFAVGVDFPEKVDAFMREHGERDGRILGNNITILVHVGRQFPVRGFLLLMHGNFWLKNRMDGLYVQALIISSEVPTDASQTRLAEWHNLKEDAGEWWQAVKNAAKFMGLVFRDDANVTIAPFYSNNSPLGDLEKTGYFGPSALEGLVFERDVK